MDSVVIQGIELRLTPPDELDWEWVGRPELRRQLRILIGNIVSAYGL